jgi:hypothetical protein
MRLMGAMATTGLLGLLACGCGQSRHDDRLIPGPPPFAGGASAGAGAGAGGANGGGEGGVRLWPWQLEADGTEPLVLGVLDTQEQVHCEFLLDSEGQLRCLPMRLPSLKLWEIGDDHQDENCAYLGDPAVLQGFQARPVSLPLPRHGCEQRYVVATISISTEEGPPSYSLSNVCAEEPPGSWGPVFTPVTIDSVLPPERWVAATRGVDGPRISGRLQVRQITGADGSTFDDQVEDEKWGTDCTLVGRDDTPQECVPPHVSFQTFFYADDACGTPLWSLPACTPATYIDGGFDSLGEHPARALGEPYQDQIYAYQGHGTRVCMPRPADSGRTGTAAYYQGGQPIEDFALAPFSWQLQGTGRLQRRGVAGDGGSFIPVADWLITEPPRYHDTITGAGCNPLRTAEGELRCVPTAVLWDPTPDNSAFYADDQCSRHAYFCFGEACDIGLAVLMDAGPSGERQATSLVRTARLMGSYTKVPDGCLFDPANTNVVELGEPAPWSQFPQLTERNGPVLSAP